MSRQNNHGGDMPDIRGINGLLAHFLGPVETLSGAELENRLKRLSGKILPLGILTCIFFIAAFAGFFFGVIALGFLKGFFIALSLLIVFGILYVRVYLLRKEAKMLVGHNIVGGILTDVFEAVEYAPTGFIDEAQIRNAALIDRGWNSCTGSDHIKAVYKGVRFTLSDIRLVWRKHDADGSQSRRTVFKGQWLIFELNRSLEAPLYIRERRSRFGGRKSNIETANAVFDGVFQVLADDQQAARRILTPRLTECLVDLSARRGTRICMCFKDNEVDIALCSGRDLFEPNVRKLIGGMQVEEMREQMRQEALGIAAVMDELLRIECLFQ